MERVEQIMRHPLYLQYQRRIDELEKDRLFCRHDRGHALDVARIMYILTLERGISFKKDVVYGAALLHDIGRAAQYEENRPHDEAGAEWAAEVLADCGYEEEEIFMVTRAIANHPKERNKGAGKEDFSNLLYEADKLSRACFDCAAQKECYWDDGIKNQKIVY